MSSILIIYTGGTIGMVQDAASGLLKPFDFEHLMAQIPELQKFNYQIDTHSFNTPIDSSNMNPDIWVKLADLISENYAKYDGFVILHGSDTMAYTASALSFMLKNLSKPIILTGSQLPIGVIRTDGKENLITAIEIAAAKKDAVAMVPEVAIYFEYQLYRGNRTTKISASHFEAFGSPNYPVLAEAGIDIYYNHQYIKETTGEDLELITGLCPDIAVLKLFPGVPPAYAATLLESDDLKVIIIETYGAGNMPTVSWLEDSITQAIGRGKHIINVSQCLKGTVKQGAYETSSFLEQAGVISGYDITLEAAITKSMMLLENYPDAFRDRFIDPICGEVEPIAS